MLNRSSFIGAYCLLLAVAPTFAADPPPATQPNELHASTEVVFVQMSGATWVMFSGSIGARIGVGEKNVELKDVELRVGKTLTVGAVPMTIRNVQALSFAGGEFGYSADGRVADSRIQVQFNSDIPLDSIRSIDFFDAAGQPVSANVYRPQFNSEGMIPPQQQSYMLTATLSRDVERATVRIKYYEKIEQATLPIEFITGLGI